MADRAAPFEHLDFLPAPGVFVYEGVVGVGGEVLHVLLHDLQGAGDDSQRVYGSTMRESEAKIGEATSARSHHKKRTERKMLGDESEVCLMHCSYRRAEEEGWREKRAREKECPVLRLRQ